MPTINQLVRKRRRQPRKFSKSPVLDKLPAEAGRLPAGQDDDAQEAELGPAEDRPRAAVQRQGSHRLHPRRRAQPAGALDRARPRRPCPRPARRALPRRPRRARHAGRRRPQASPQPVRSEEVAKRSQTSSRLPCDRSQTARLQADQSDRIADNQPWVESPPAARRSRPIRVTGRSWPASSSTA